MGCGWVRRLVACVVHLSVKSVLLIMSEDMDT